MDWGKTKTIFIVSFLILNVFLTWQLVETNSANQLSIISEATIQERLKQNNITIKVELPEEDLVGLHVIGKNTLLTNEITAKLFDQNVKIMDERTLVSLLEDPYELDLKNLKISITQFLTMYVYKGDQYRYGHYDPDTKKILLYQVYEGKTAYTFEDEPLTLQLDDDNRIIGYQQSYFEFEDLQGREREMMSSLKAIEILLNEKIIEMNDTVTNVEFGYYSFFSPQGDVQVFAPMWRVSLEDDHTYLVNAIEGTVQQLT